MDGKGHSRDKKRQRIDVRKKLVFNISFLWSVLGIITNRQDFTATLWSKDVPKYTSAICPRRHSLVSHLTVFKIIGRVGGCELQRSHGIFELEPRSQPVAKCIGDHPICGRFLSVHVQAIVSRNLNSQVLLSRHRDCVATTQDSVPGK